jgi:hypothetical protein
MRARRVAVVALLLLAVGRVGLAAETARQILDRRKALDDTTRKWRDREERLAMTIRDARGGDTSAGSRATSGRRSCSSRAPPK